MLAVLASEIGPDNRVRALHLVRQCLADVVQKRGALAVRYVETELSGHQPGDMGTLHQMLEDVLCPYEVR